MPALYPVLQENYALTFTQIGFLHFAFQTVASPPQPVVGWWTDVRPRLQVAADRDGDEPHPGCRPLAWAQSYVVLLLAAVCVGLGVVDLSSGRLEAGAGGVGRAVRDGAVGVPGRWQYRQP